MTQPTVNGPVAKAATPEVERVFVGIPDTFTAEQAARATAMGYLERSFLDFGPDREPVGEGLSKRLAAAERVAAFILDGTV